MRYASNRNTGSALDPRDYDGLLVFCRIFVSACKISSTHFAFGFVRGLYLLAGSC